MLVATNKRCQRPTSDCETALPQQSMEKRVLGILRLDGVISRTSYSGGSSSLQLGKAARAAGTLRARHFARDFVPGEFTFSSFLISERSHVLGRRGSRGRRPRSRGPVSSVVIAGIAAVIIRGRRSAVVNCSQYPQVAPAETVQGLQCHSR